MSRSEHFLLGASHGVSWLAHGAAEYAASMGQRRPLSPSTTVVTPQMSQAIGDAYRALPDFDPRAVPAFKQMGREVSRQFDFMTGARSKGGLGLEVEVTDTDPYVKPGGGPDPAAMMRDVVHDRRLKVLSTRSTGEHPLFSNDENDMFRAVHDAFGHAGTGRGFDRHGEEAAFQTHASMFSPLARMALATETRGQNSAFVTRSPGEGFQTQKVALLPKRLAAPNTFFGDRSAAITQARHFNEKQFGGLLSALQQSQ